MSESAITYPIYCLMSTLIQTDIHPCSITLKALWHQHDKSCSLDILHIFRQYRGRLMYESYQWNLTNNFRFSINSFYRVPNTIKNRTYDLHHMVYMIWVCQVRFRPNDEYLQENFPNPGSKICCWDAYFYTKVWEPVPQLVINYVPVPVKQT